MTRLVRTVTYAEALLGTVAYLPVKTTDAARQSADKVIYCPVRILGTRMTYGRLKALVEPVGGRGRMWVEVQRLEIPDMTTG